MPDPESFWTRPPVLWAIAGGWLLVTTVITLLALSKLWRDISLQSLYALNPQTLEIRMLPVSLGVGFMEQMAWMLRSVGVYRLALADLDGRDTSPTLLFQDWVFWSRFLLPAVLGDLLQVGYGVSTQPWIFLWLVQLVPAVPLVFVFPIMLDKGCGFTQAAFSSARLAMPRFFTVLWKIVRLGFVAEIGCAALLVGGIASLPVYQFGIARLYRELCAVQTIPQTSDKLEGGL